MDLAALLTAGEGSPVGAVERQRADARTDELGKDEFLRLLTTQLRFQDPVSPIKDQDFIAQLAQFAALEHIQKLTAQVGRYLEMQFFYAALSQASGLIGRTVQVKAPDGLETVDGVVSGVRLVDGQPHLVVNGQLYRAEDLFQILA